jgi:hypothetical protein
MGNGQPVLLIDLGGVLLTFDHPHRLKMLGSCLGLAPGEADALLWRSGFSADCDAGRYPSAAAVRAEIRRRTGYAGPGQDLDAAWCSAFRPGQDVLAMLASHRGQRGVWRGCRHGRQQVGGQVAPDLAGGIVDGVDLVAARLGIAGATQITSMRYSTLAAARLAQAAFRVVPWNLMAKIVNSGHRSSGTTAIARRRCFGPPADRLVGRVVQCWLLRASLAGSRQLWSCCCTARAAHGRRHTASGAVRWMDGLPAVVAGPS